MPCLEWFDAQELAYRDAVLLPSVRARVSVEAGATLGWWRYVGDSGRVIGLDHFGASADQAALYREFGITVDTDRRGGAREHRRRRPRLRTDHPTDRSSRTMPSTNPRLQTLTDAGVSIWLDDLDRNRLAVRRARPPGARRAACAA